MTRFAIVLVGLALLALPVRTAGTFRFYGVFLSKFCVGLMRLGSFSRLQRLFFQQLTDSIRGL